MPVHSIVSAVFFTILCVLITPGMNGRVFAEGECIEHPNRESAQEGHWYYHYDREKNRKCWHLEAIAPRTRDVAPPQTDRKDTVATPTISSVLSSLFRGWRVAPGSSPPPLTAAGEPRIIQSDPTKPLTIDDIARRQPDIPEERSEPRYETRLTRAQRRALFEEYLKWEELHRSLGNTVAPARSP
jgi:hypothetical protein